MSTRTSLTNHTIGKTGKLLGYVKQYSIHADYSKSPYCPKCHGSPPQTTGHRYLHRAIRRPYKESTPEIRALRRGTCGTEWDTCTIHLQLGIGQVFPHCGAVAEIGERAGTQKHLAGTAKRVISFANSNALLDSIRVFYKMSPIPLAYGRALVTNTKGGVL